MQTFSGKVRAKRSSLFLRSVNDEKKRYFFKFRPGAFEMVFHDFVENWLRSDGLVVDVLENQRVDLLTMLKNFWRP